MHLNFCETDENPQSASVIYTCAAIRRRNWVVNNRAGFMTKVARSSGIVILSCPSKSFSLNSSQLMATMVLCLLIRDRWQ